MNALHERWNFITEHVKEARDPQVPDLVAASDLLAKSAAEGYAGEPDRSGDPTQSATEEPKGSSYTAAVPYAGGVG